MLELLIDSDFEVPSWARESILSLITQLNLGYSQRSALNSAISQLAHVDLVPHGVSVAEDVPDLMHIVQLSAVCDRLFRESLGEDVLALYHLGAAVGEGLGMNLWRGAEPSQDEYEAIREALESLPEDLNVAFDDLKRILREFRGLSFSDLKVLLDNLESLNFDSSSSFAKSIESLEVQEPNSLLKSFRELEIRKPKSLLNTLTSLGVADPQAVCDKLGQLSDDQYKMLLRHLESLQPSLLMKQLSTEEYKYLKVLRRVVREEYGNHFTLLDHLAEKLRRLDPDSSNLKLEGGGRTIWRDLHFLKWSLGERKRKGLTPARIRDKWNEEHPDDRIHSDNRGIDVVKKGITRAKAKCKEWEVEVLAAIRSKEAEKL